ncbi:hypothetical protein DKP78_18470, partial [Enterococcus faecium]
AMRPTDAAVQWLEPSCGSGEPFSTFALQVRWQLQGLLESLERPERNGASRKCGQDVSQLLDCS